VFTAEEEEEEEFIYHK